MVYDIFKLHDKDVDRNPNSWIEIQGKFLVKIMHSLVETIIDETNATQNQISSKISLKLKCGRSTIEKKISYIRRKTINWVPLCLIIELLNFLEKNERNEWKKYILADIEYMKTNSSKCNVIKTINHNTKELAKILGAHVADGYLQIYTNKRGSKNYIIKIVDFDIQAIKKLNFWFKTVFGIESKAIYSKKDNAWVIYYPSKIIARYFTKIFGIPSGKKSYSIEMPRILLKDSLDIQKEFLKGYLTFDGGVKLSGYIGFSTMSNKLRTSLENIIKKLGIYYSLNKSKKDAYVFEMSVDSNCLDLIEEGTEKWYKIYDIINGFKQKAESEHHAINILKYIYRTKGANKTNLQNIYNSIKLLKKCNINQLLNTINLNETKVAKTTLYKYLKILLQTKIIKKEYFVVLTKKNGFKTTTYSYNNKTKEWKVPSRPWIIFPRHINNEKNICRLNQ